MYYIKKYNLEAIFLSREVSQEMMEMFITKLYSDEKSENTISKYQHDIRQFFEFSKGKEICKVLVMEYKAFLSSKYAVSSVNSMLAALNSFLKFCDWDDCCVKPFKVQKRIFCSEEQELTKAEYVRLVETAKKSGNERMYFILQTICGTGIRVSELQYITVEAVRNGEAIVNCKGKTRVVIIVKALQKRLLNYIKCHKRESGAVFVTRTGKPINRTNVWREMKGLCERAQVKAEKVFPHNLRHLFARVFYKIEKDIVKLADILGHTSINTTRIYMMSTIGEHRNRMEQMHLII